MDTQLHEQLITTMTRLTEAIASFDANTFNTVPFEGSWTGGQVADHLYKSQANIGKVLNGNTAAPDRDPLQHKPLLEQVFLNFDNKMKSPDFIIPSEGPHSKDAYIALFGIITSDIEGAINALDLTELCLDFKLPNLGVLTREELIWFVVYHTQRHTRQLQNIKRTLAPTVQQTA